MRRTASKKKKKKARQSRYVGIIVLFLIVVMGVQMANLYHKNSEYEEREAALEAELLEQQARQEELAAYEAYTQTEEYKENVSRTKLGLVRDNEIIFREE